MKRAMPLSEEQCLRLMFVAVVTLLLCIFCFFALCVLLSMPSSTTGKKTSLLLFTAGHGVCGTVHQVKSHRLAGAIKMVRRSAVSYRK